ASGGPAFGGEVVEGAGEDGTVVTGSELALVVAAGCEGPQATIPRARNVAVRFTGEGLPHAHPGGSAAASCAALSNRAEGSFAIARITTCDHAGASPGRASWGGIGISLQCLKPTAMGVSPAKGGRPTSAW